MSRSSRARVLACLTAAMMLAAQVLVHRMVSLKLLSNYAFFVISLTMLGLGFSGVLLTRLLERFLKAQAEWFTLCAAGFAVTFVAASSLLYGAHGDSSSGFTRVDFVIDFFRWMPFALAFAVPFTFLGLILGTLLSSPEYSTRHIYFFDLVGSAAGAFAILPVISGIGVETAVVAVAALQLLGTCALWIPSLRWSRFVGVAAAVVIAACGLAKNEVLNPYIQRGTPLSVTRDPSSGASLLAVAWDPLGRAELTQIKGPPANFVHPAIFGDDPQFRARFQRMLTQNNWTWTYSPYYDGNPDSLKGIERTFYATTYFASSVKSPRVVAIGVGGGGDILAALHFGASEVTGVEANGATLRMLTERDRDYFSKWVTDPRVHLVHEEGRHFLASSDEHYDIIQLSGVDTYAGTPGAAHVFTESYLYTVQAFETYLARLTDDGILGVVRAEWPPPREMVRAEATAVQALREMGVSTPARHIAMIRSANLRLVALLVKKTPFSDEELTKMDGYVGSNPLLQIAAGPRWNAQRENTYERFLALDDPQEEHDFLVRHWANIVPADDDKPFFFRFSYWWHLFPRSPGVWEQVPFMEYSLTLLFLTVGGAALVCLYLPLRTLRRRGNASVSDALLWRFALYFGALGLGYMALEIAFIQRFALLLGHPNYALSVVLAVLLFSTGLGSLWARRIVLAVRGVRFAAYLVATIVLLEYFLAFPNLPKVMPAAFVVRCVVTIVLIAPIGLCLGVFMPSGLDRLKAIAPELVPWAWGTNGILSVLGPIFAIALSITFGTSALLLSALPIYLLAGWILGAVEPSIGPVAHSLEIEPMVGPHLPVVRPGP